MRDPVDICLNNYLQSEDEKEARAEMLGEARYEAAEMRDAAKEAWQEDCFYDIVLDFKEGYLSESIGLDMSHAICALYHSLPLKNGRLARIRGDRTNYAAWNLIQAYMKTEEVKDILEFLWEQR